MHKGCYEESRSFRHLAHRALAALRAASDLTSGVVFTHGLLSNLCHMVDQFHARSWQRPKSSCKSRYFGSALGRTRTCDLLIRSPFPSETGADTEGQGATKPRLISGIRYSLADRKGHGGTLDCGQIAVKTSKGNKVYATPVSIHPRFFGLCT